MPKERKVHIGRCVATGEFVLRPVGTYKGYGGFVTLPLCRMLPSDASPKAMGTLVLELLQLSGPTGIHYKDYPSQEVDAESRRVMKRFGLKDASREFDSANVAHREDQSSWKVIPHERTGRDTFKAKAPIRVAGKGGPEALGRVILDALITQQKLTSSKATLGARSRSRTRLTRSDTKT
jgi:hypothetical protein